MDQFICKQKYSYNIVAYLLRTKKTGVKLPLHSSENFDEICRKNGMWKHHLLITNKKEIAMVSCLRFIWITSSSTIKNYRKV